jgi:hydroxymethylpyrimidine/phosphomethylpyrimidine kinase
MRTFSILAGLKVRDKESMEEAASRLHRLGPQIVVVKGGHLKGDPDDIVYDGKTYSLIKGTRHSGNYHGLGCAYSSAIAGFLALGYDAKESIRKAKNFLEKSLRRSFAPSGGRRILTFSRSRKGYNL